MQTRRLQQAIIAQVCFHLKRFEFYTSIFKGFTRLKYIIIYAAPQQNNYTDNGDQPGHPLTTALFSCTALVQASGSMSASM